MTDTPAELAPIPDAPAPVPVPILAGTFAIYPDGRGGFVITADTVDQDDVHTVHQKQIPAAMVKMVQGAGPMGKMFGKLL